MDSERLGAFGTDNLSESTTIRCKEPLEGPWKRVGILEFAFVSS